MSTQEQDKAMDDMLDACEEWTLVPTEKVDHQPRITPRTFPKDWFDAPRNARYPD